MRLNKNGSSIIAAAAIVLFFSVLGFGVAGMVSVGGKGGAAAVSSQEAFQIAEAGVRLAEWAVANDAGLVSQINSGKEFNLGRGVFTAEVVESGNLTKIIAGGYVPDRQNYRARRVLKVEISKGGDVIQNIFSSRTINLTGSAQIHGFDWELQAPATDYTVETNNELKPGPGQNSFITADNQVEFSSRTLSDAQIPGELVDMEFTSQGDPGISGSYRIDSGHNFYMGLWPYRPSSTFSDGSYKFNDLDLISGVEIIVEGNVVLFVLGKINMPANALITITDGASLKIYLGSPGGEIHLGGTSRINDGGRPSDVSIVSASARKINLIGNVRLNAVLYAPYAEIGLSGSPELWGAAAADSIQLLGNSRIYCVNEDPSSQGPSVSGKKWSEMIR